MYKWVGVFWAFYSRITMRFLSQVLYLRILVSEGLSLCDCGVNVLNMLLWKALSIVIGSFYLGCTGIQLVCPEILCFLLVISSLNSVSN